ncbi:MAG: ABC transporter permease [Oscillospiraceae bacterium]|jgi:simple sugar transport system permease protein|nr:ABC transporter permease [Oscillospiraceae bacterium]
MSPLKKRRSVLRSDGLQTLISSLLCIILGLAVGYLVLLLINAAGAWDATMAIVKNFFKFTKAETRMKNFGLTLAKTAPLLMCSLSVLFAYKVGLFNIGAAGQYTAGVCAALIFALHPNFLWPWWACLLVAVAAGAILGAICGALRAYCNVNVVISGIMLNWITLYLTNWVLAWVKNPASPYTKELRSVNTSALIPSMGLEKFFNNKNVTISVVLVLLIAVVIWIILKKTKFGYELKATGNNLHAAKYCGMKENRNIILTMVIAGALAAAGAGLFYLAGIEEWSTTQSAVPGMGFNGIAVAFLGGLNPLGAILSSYFIQHITTAGGYVNLQVYSAQISDFISSMIIYLCAFVGFFKMFINLRLDKGEERKARKAALLASTEEGGADE